MRLENVIVDAHDIRALADFWGQALGWDTVVYDNGETSVSAPGSDPSDPSTWQFPELMFEPVADRSDGRERVHLDLASSSVEEQAATVDRLLALGATRADAGQAPDAPWVVLADPEGNQFCVLDPRDEYRDTGPLAAIVVATRDAGAVKDFWAVATGWDLARDDPGFVSFRDPRGSGPYLELISREGPDPDDRRKNRIHLDVAPAEHDDQAAWVERLVGMGATHRDVGQGPEVTWVVLADPEGNEFCVLSPRA